MGTPHENESTTADTAEVQSIELEESIPLGDDRKFPLEDRRETETIYDEDEGVTLDVEEIKGPQGPPVMAYVFLGLATISVSSAAVVLLFLTDAPPLRRSAWRLEVKDSSQGDRSIPD